MNIQSMTQSLGIKDLSHEKKHNFFKVLLVAQFMILYQVSLQALDQVDKFYRLDSRYTRRYRLESSDGKPLCLLKIIGKKTWSEGTCESFREDLAPYRRTHGAILSRIVRAYFGTKAIEIGSGKCPITNYLTEVPQKISEGIDLSDYSVADVAGFNQTSQRKKMIQLDIANLSKQLTKTMYDTVLLHDVLSVLDRDELNAACREVLKILPSQGILIHFRTRLPFSAATIEQFTDNESIVFPLTNRFKHQIGIIVIDKKEFELRVNELDSSNPIKKILIKYQQYKPAEREEFSEIMSDLKSGRVSKHFLSEIVKSLGFSTVKFIRIDEEFRDRIDTILKNAGFDVLFNDFITESKIDLRTKYQKENRHQFKVTKSGNLITDYLGILAPNKVQETVTVHVTVARKPIS